MKACTLAPTLNGEAPVPFRFGRRTSSDCFDKRAKANLISIYIDICEVASNKPVFGIDGVRGYWGLEICLCRLSGVGIPHGASCMSAI